MENVLLYLAVGAIVVFVNYMYRTIESGFWKYRKEPTLLDLIFCVFIWPVAMVMLAIDVTIAIKGYFKTRKND